MHGKNTVRVIYSSKAQLGRVYDKTLSPIAYFGNHRPGIGQETKTLTIGNIVYTCMYHGYKRTYTVTLPCKRIRAGSSISKPELYAYDPDGAPKTFTLLAEFSTKALPLRFSGGTEQADLIDPVLQEVNRQERNRFINEKWNEQKKFLSENPDYVENLRTSESQKAETLKRKENIEAKVMLGRALVDMRDAAENLMKLIQDDNASITPETFSDLYQVIEKLSNVQRKTKSYIINAPNKKSKKK